MENESIAVCRVNMYGTIRYRADLKEKNVCICRFTHVSQGDSGFVRLRSVDSRRRSGGRMEHDVQQVKRQQCVRRQNEIVDINDGCMVEYYLLGMRRWASEKIDEKRKQLAQKERRRWLQRAALVDGRWASLFEFKPGTYTQEHRVQRLDWTTLGTKKKDHRESGKKN